MERHSGWLAALGAALLGAVLVYAATATLDPYLLSIIAFVGINIILAVSLNITNGFTGLFSLGHPAFMTVGGYVTAILTLLPARKTRLLPDLPAALSHMQWPFLPALIAGGLIATLVAVIVGFPVLRLRGHYLAVATLADLHHSGARHQSRRLYARGARPQRPAGAHQSVVGLWLGAGDALCLLDAQTFLARAHHAGDPRERAGRRLPWREDHPDADSVLRARRLLCRRRGWPLGSSRHAGDADLLTFLLAFQLVVMVVLGGSGSITGAVLAAAVLTIATEALHLVEEAVGLYGLSQMLLAVAVLMVLIFRPKGLFGMAEPDLLGWIGKLHGRQPTRSGSKCHRDYEVDAIERMTVAAVIGLVAAASHARAADPIKIVALYNLSAGGLASIDGPSLNGAKLMAKQINDAGGLLGGRMIELTAIDTKNDQKEAATGAKRAVSMEGVVAGIGHSDTTFALASAPLFQAQGIPFVTSGATSPDLPDMVGNQMFLACFADDVQAHAMAEYAYNTLGVKNIVMWTDNAMDYTKGLSKYFQDRFTQLGKVLLSDVYMTEDKDFSALVSRLKANPDAQALFASSGPIPPASSSSKSAKPESSCRSSVAMAMTPSSSRRCRVRICRTMSISPRMPMPASTPARPTHPRGLSEGLWQPAGERLRGARL